MSVIGDFITFFQSKKLLEKNRLTHQVSTYDLSKLNIYLFICRFKKIRNFRNPKIRNQSHRHHTDEKLF